ncbi:MAG: hypothetical protein C0595_11455 [Marinilabiliales bacterium]|nr:MAG: hypothetical protein C0595_11455 [Marinilabiliales bacterium]
MKKITNLKHSILLILAILLVSNFSSCKKAENTTVVNKWKLIEQYSDPGDGSGDFNPVESSKTIEFLDNGTIVSNGSLCSMSYDVDGHSTATYNDSTIITNNCDYENFTIYYQLKDNNLILWYPCIEGCAQKYQKLD